MMALPHLILIAFKKLFRQIHRGIKGLLAVDWGCLKTHTQMLLLMMTIVMQQALGTYQKLVLRDANNANNSRWQYIETNRCNVSAAAAAIRAHTRSRTASPPFPPPPPRRRRLVVRAPTRFQTTLVLQRTTSTKEPTGVTVQKPRSYLAMCLSHPLMIAAVP